MATFTYNAVADLMHSITETYRNADVAWVMHPKAWRSWQRAKNARRDMKWKSKGMRRHIRRQKEGRRWAASM